MQQRFKSQFAEFSVCIIWASQWFLGIIGITLLMGGKKKKKVALQKLMEKGEFKYGLTGDRIIASLIVSLKKKKKSWRRLTDSHESGPNCCPGPLRATYISSSPNGQPLFPTGQVSLLPWLVQSFYHFFCQRLLTGGRGVEVMDMVFRLDCLYCMRLWPVTGRVIPSRLILTLFVSSAIKSGWW